MTMKSEPVHQHPTTAELLTVDQFALRLQVSRATVFAWMHKQILVQGRHFLRFGRVLRFIWSDDLVSSLLQDSAQALPVAAPAIRPVCLTSKKTGSSLNWEY
jgi:predicted DNA-binding transcriptional regulator AlpA